MEYYLIIKSLHIVAVISWMAALLYLPRLFAYHSQNNITKETSETFKIMEKKLANIIMKPAMIASVILGLALIHFSGGFAQLWIHIKLTLALLMLIFHFFLLKCLKKFASNENKYSEKFFRIINEIPAILMIFIVFVAILKPF
jgi:putative membrane protein